MKLLSLDFIVGAIVGAVVSYLTEKLFDRLRVWISQFRDQRRWRKAEKVWKKYQSLSFGLELVQTGWRQGAFVEQQVLVTIEGSFQLPRSIAVRTHNPWRAEWEEAGLTNNEQFGISEIDPHRVTDEMTSKTTITHELHIRGHTYHYFDFLATHRLYHSGTQREKEFLAAQVDEFHSLRPVARFPNPLSVGLSLFCENGNCLVLTRRTKLPSMGGQWFGHSVYNAVGENMILSDVCGEWQGNTRLSPWTTAKRGLREEMGIEYYEGAGVSLVLHSFVWDTRILDYKFFGYVTNALSRADVRRSWDQAPDKHESWEIEFHDCGNSNLASRLVRQIIDHREEWASECILCTILSLLHLKKLSPDRLEELLLSS